ncbi:probable galacturonosyltransferase 15 [Zingiber officinale]|uniref:probable galacturonosyltransferase 15 n=1 Tax=Zingiber officinale TaxID=94328 RepID=UPI001C4D57F4|nr:probable galacturonosyltransferase 15 [Zingiber officinale]
MNLVKPAPARRIHHRFAVPAVLLAALFLPFVFIRAAFLALDARAASISCLGWRIGPRLLLDPPQDFTKELSRVYLEKGGQELDPQLVTAAPDSMEDLISEMSSSDQHLDLRSFLLKTKAMLLKMDQKVQSARLQAVIFRHLASVGLPKSIHCLTLRLAQLYLINAAARSSLPPPEYASRLTNNSYHHIALITDNVVAAAVVVSSTISSCADPEKLVFHIVTDKKTCNSMHAWFALHSFLPAVVEVRGLHQFDFPPDANAVIMKTVEELRQSSSAYRYYRGSGKEYRRLLALRPSMFSLLNYMWIHLPELFTKLEKLIFLEDDVVVQRDLTPLWHLELQGLVMGAVSSQDSDEVLNTGPCVGKMFADYLNFSNSLLSSPLLGLQHNSCAWLQGLNIFDLQAWRKNNITRAYQHWLKLNRESGFTLWPMGSLPPALIAFNKQNLQIEHSWLLTGLGWRMPDPDELESAAVIHFSGAGKPWLETGHAELQRIWQSHLNHSDELISSCMVI